MDIFSLIIICVLCLIIWGIIFYPRVTYIAISKFPRDAFGLYKFFTTVLFCFYCKLSNQTASTYFDKAASKRMMQTCFLYEDEVWTFKNVQTESLKIAKYFKNAGYKKGDVVGLLMENRPDYVTVWLGLGRLGVVTSLLNHNLRLKSLGHCIEVSNCKGLIFGTELTSVIEECLESEDISSDLQLYSMDDRTPPKLTQRLTSQHINLSEELEALNSVNLDKDEFLGLVNNRDVAVYIFTSGTTGLPKAAKMKYSRMFSYGSSVFPLCMDPAKDVLLTALPLYHIQGGFVGVLCAIFHGVPQVIVRKFSASNFWQQCIKYEVTYCQYLGEILRYLYNQPEKPEDKLHKVHTFCGNGANPAIWEKFVKRFNVKIMEMYGSTEGNCNVVNIEGHIGAVGYLPILLYPFLPVYFARVKPTTGELVRDSATGLVEHVELMETGELLGKIKNYSPLGEFEGYTDEQATKEKIVGDIKRRGDRWFRTGDIFTRDEYGYVYFKDRTGDTFKWKGENVCTFEVEQILAKASGYRGVAVYGVQVPGMEGRCGMASISNPNNDLDIRKMSEIVLRRLPPYARPVFIRLSKEDLKTTGTYKLQKVELQQEGFDLNIVKDSIVILQQDGYVPLDGELYQQILQGSLRL